MISGENALKTLFHPFETGDLALPARSERVLFLGAEPGFRLPAGFGGKLALVQGFRPSFLKLRASGLAVTPEADGEGYALALVLAGKHRGLNESRIAEALRRVVPGGVVVVAGSKDDGIASLRKRIGTLTPLDGSASKHHGVAFWLRSPPDARAVAVMLAQPNAPALIEGRFRTAPGMFSHDRVDAGTRLLAAQIPADLKGTVADFCAGWGYLAAVVAERCPGLTALELYEADHASLEAARLNLAAAKVPVSFHWSDLASEPVARHLDAIVMNPPFHTGHAAEPAIGEAMIRAASAALKPGGRLILVANRGLPYEKPLAQQFRRSGESLREATYKVLWAIR